MSEQKEAMEEANQIMANYMDLPQFKDRLPIVIYFAAHQTCQTCGAGISQPCTNVSKSINKMGQVNRWPHSARIDWILMVKTLRERGYHRDGEE